MTSTVGFNGWYATYDAVCKGFEAINKRIQDVTLSTFENPSAAAVARVAIKTFSVLLVEVITPLPSLLLFPVLTIAELALNRGRLDRLFYVATAIQVRVFQKIMQGMFHNSLVLLPVTIALGVGAYLLGQNVCQRFLQHSQEEAVI